MAGIDKSQERRGRLPAVLAAVREPRVPRLVDRVVVADIGEPDGHREQLALVAADLAQQFIDPLQDRLHLLTRRRPSRLLGNLTGGTWSNDGRYRAFSTNRRAQPVAVWDSQTGLARTYCIPQTGARLYEGKFTWSPDNHYLALQAPLPEDENEEGVGRHMLILNIETGEIVDLTSGVGDLMVWSQEPGSYGEGN